MAKVKDATCQGGEMERKYKDGGYSTEGQLENNRKGTYEIQRTH